MMRFTAVTAAVALLVGVLAAPSLSSDRGDEVEWIQATCKIEEGEESTRGGSQHVRGEKHHDTIYMNMGEGYVRVGSNLIVMDYDVGASGNGRGGGTFAADLPALSAAFSGHFNGRIEAGMLTARAVGDGSGAMEGAKMKARIVQFVPSEEQLVWMCEGDEVAKAVSVSANIRPAKRVEYQRAECVTPTGGAAVNEVVDGVLTIRDLPYLGVLTDEAGNQTGTNTGLVDLDLDRTSGKGWIRGTLTIRDTIMGDFDGTFRARYRDFAWEGRGEAQGVDEDEGKRLKMDVASFVPDEAACGPAPQAGWIDGAVWDVEVKIK